MILVSFSFWPSSMDVLVAIFAIPILCSAPYSQSPDESPVKMRPVRFAPWAPGANPTISNFGLSDPKPGIGFPQYVWSSYDFRLTTATSSRH
jgi:hypothetical protein